MRARKRKRGMGKAMVALPLAAPSMVRKVDRMRASCRELLEPAAWDGEEIEVVSADGTVLSARVSGDRGPTVFFVHGWMCNQTIFRYQLEFLRETHRVVTLDLRGHGRSAIPKGLEYDTEVLAQDLKSVVDRVNPDEFVVAGHSMGGFTAFKFYEFFSGEYEGRLKGLAVIDSTGTDLVDGIVMGNLIKKAYPRPLAGALTWLGLNNRVSDTVKGLVKNTPFAYVLVRWAAFGREPDGYQVEFVRDMLFQTPMTTIALAAKACLDFNYFYYLPEVDVPVILLVGDKDKLTSLKANQRTAELLPRAETVVFPGAGHCTLLERRGEFNRELAGFLARVCREE